MKHQHPRTQADTAPPAIGKILKALRKSRRISLAKLACDTGVSEATLSRIENGHSEASAALLYDLATLLRVEISTFFTTAPMPLHSGVRSVMRAGDGAKFTSERLNARVLSADIAQKSMHPFVNVTYAKSLGETGGLNTHNGEEFLFVLQGTLILHTLSYEPLRLEMGDSIYFDATQPHAYVCGGNEKTEYLVITSARMPEMNPNPKEPT